MEVPLARAVPLSFLYGDIPTETRAYEDEVLPAPTIQPPRYLNKSKIQP